jgi:hypothetical protein
MNDFVDRMAAQRGLLRVVNSRPWAEELYGLSHAGIHRWVVANQLSNESAEVKLVREAAKALNFLAARSQEQVTPDYQRVCAEVSFIAGRLRAHFATARTLTGR